MRELWCCAKVCLRVDKSDPEHTHTPVWGLAAVTALDDALEVDTSFVTAGWSLVRCGEGHQVDSRASSVVRVNGLVPSSLALGSRPTSSAPNS